MIWSRLTLLCCSLCFSLISIAQSTTRDAIKIGGGYNLLTVEDASAAVAYIEYSRVFYPPITIAVSANISKADDIMTVFEKRQLTSFAFDLMGYYSFLQDRVQDMRVGFMMTTRSFLTEWENVDTGATGKDRKFHPGIGLVLNYDVHVSDLLLLGVKGSVAQYNNRSSVFLIGGHVGVKF